MKRIKIATDFSDTPLGRFPADSDWSGERFREEFLRPALAREGTVEVDLDGVEGYGSSFLEEAFGGLVRLGYFTPQALQQKLQIVYTDPDNESYGKLIWKHIRDAGRRKK